MATPVTQAEQYEDLHFSKAGLDLSLAYSKQPARKVFGGEYARTTADCLNVRTYDPGTNRNRGGCRPGLSRLIDHPVLGSYWIVQEINYVIKQDSMPQPSQSGRVVTGVAVSQGKVFTFAPGDTAYTTSTNSSSGSPPLNTTGTMQSAQLNQKLYFADGTNYRFYTPSTNVVADWVASAGSLPEDSAHNYPRLICTWRGRIVLSGLLLDPQNWFMSKSGDATNYDYGPATPGPTDAIAGNNSPLGIIGDVITALVPYTDDVLIFGGDHTIYMLRGDPLNGGSIDLVSSTIGFAWGQAWVKDPYGTVYFVSNKMGVYSFVPGQTMPVRISQQIESRLAQVDTGANSIRLVWDDRFQGFNLFITPLAEPGPTTHYYYDQRSGAWFADAFTNHEFDPVACCTFDGNGANDRLVLIGSWDGYIRVLDPTAPDDDGVPIESSVLLGPLVTKDLDDVMAYEMQGVLGETSGDVAYDVLVGSTPEAATSAAAFDTGTFTAGRSLSRYVRAAGHGIYFRLRSTVQWSMEAIRVRVGALGKIRRRGS